MSQRLKVVYISGAGRSGTTLIDNVLGQVPRIFSAGEMRFIWDRNVRDDRICGCGESFSRCPVWSQIMAHAFGAHPPDGSMVVRWRESAVRLRSAPFASSSCLARRTRARSANFLTTLERLYHATAEVTGSRVVVDSSKYPDYGYLLSLIDSLDVRVVHVIRDPRAVAHSLTRSKMERRTQQTVQAMDRVSPYRSAVDWALWAVLAEHYGRQARPSALRLRYEDFVARPTESIERIARHADIGLPALDFIHEGWVRMGANHTVGGNPGRHTTGRVTLTLDEDWRARMRPLHRRVVTTATTPWRLAYGYRRGAT